MFLEKSVQFIVSVIEKQINITIIIKYLKKKKIRIIDQFRSEYYIINLQLYNDLSLNSTIISRTLNS